MKLFIVLMVSCFSAVSFAQDVANEFFYQAKQGKMFVQADYFRNSYTIDATDPGAGDGEIKANDNILQAAFELGITDVFSVYGNIGYGAFKAEDKYEGIAADSYSADGLNPLNLGAKASVGVGPGKVFTRANLNLGALDKEDCGTDGDNCNRTDSSNKLALRLGYLMSYESGFAGIALDLGLLSTDGEDVNGEKYEYKNGFGVTAFYEHIYKQGILGSSLNYRQGVLDDSSLTNVFSINSFKVDILSLNFYTRVPLVEGYDLLANVNYKISSESDEEGVNDITGYSFGLGLRVAL